jgi:putative membrane protein insertion efficiency factor
LGNKGFAMKAKSEQQTLAVHESRFRPRPKSVFCIPVLALIRFYQKSIAPQVMSRKCRFTPSCSQYACEAIAQYGLLVGGFMAYKRIERCRPNHASGEDPVP